MCVIHLYTLIEIIKALTVYCWFRRCPVGRYLKLVFLLAGPSQDVFLLPHIP